jgi:hypothetical protein
MKRSLVLNFEVLRTFNISVEEFLFLYNISEEKTDVNILNVDLDKLQREQLIKIIKEEKEIYILREKSIELIEFLTIEIESSFTNSKKTVKKSDRAINEDIGKRLESFRAKWKGLRPGSMGSQKSCKIKLTRWMKENPEYSFDDILSAADIYIESLDGSYKFLQRADYFIFKQENNREESSRLSAYVDEIGVTNSNDWTTNLK